MNDAALLPQTLLTLAQSLKLVGLAPCVFVVLFLSALARRDSQVILPACYFLSLACAFVSPLLPLFFPGGAPEALIGALLMGESTLAAVGFLMILQFLSGRVPPAAYWLVLAIPFVGGGGMLMAYLMQGECKLDQGCADIESMRTLYNIVSSALVFLLLMATASRFDTLAAERERRHKYALVVALIAVHLLVLATDLALLDGHLKPVQADMIATVLRLTFVYLVLTSLFRVFYPSLITEIVAIPAVQYHPEHDAPHAEALRRLLEDEKIYREMRLNRAALAKRVGVGEHHLSRIINGRFGQSFNDLVNGYRIDEAKQRLRGEDTAITTIAFEVGFNSIASFNRVFKARAGVSPTEFRETSSPS